MALDQSYRYTDLSLDEDELIKQGRHVLVAYIMRPKSGYNFLATAAHFAAESSTGTNVEVCTTDDHTRSVDALVYHADESSGLIKIAYPIDLFDRNILDGKAMVASFLTLCIGNNQGMGDVEYAKMYDFYFPPEYLKLYDGPSTTLSHFWKILGRPEQNGGLIVGTIIKPKLGLKPAPFAKAAYDFWLGGDFIKNDEPQGNQPFAPLKETITLTADSLRRAQDKTGKAKLFSANITADDHDEMLARGEFILSAFKENSEHVAFLVDGYVAGPSAVTTARKNFPGTYIHYHRAGHGAVTSPQSKRGYTSLVLCKLARLLGASGIHTGTMGFGKMEGEASDRLSAYMLEQDIASGPYFEQPWFGIKPTTPIISGGMNAIRALGFFENLGHGNIIMTAGGGCYGHLDGPAEGARSLRQAYECWLSGADPLEYAKEHRALARAFESFSSDADERFAGWRKAFGVS